MLVVYPSLNAVLWHLHCVDVAAELVLAEAFKSGRVDQILVPEYETNYLLPDPRSRIRNNAAAAISVPLFDRS